MVKDKKNIVKKEEASVPAVLGNQGMLGNIDPKDLLLPRIDVGQGLSPQVTNADSPIKVGDLFNSVTEEVYEKPVLIIPVKNEKNFIKWVARDQGGGIVYRTDDPKDERVIQDTKWGEDGAKPSCTAYLNFLCILPGEEMPVVASFHDTSYKAGRKLLTMMAMAGGKVLSYKLNSTDKTNSFGTFQIFTVEKGDAVEGADLERAVELHKVFSDVKMNFSEERTEGTPSTEETEEF